MISSVRGVVGYADQDSVVVEVGGVGLTVAVTPHIARTARVGEPLFLHTSLIVREDALSLVGFETRDELTTFLLLVGVTGVGPKSALGVLSAMSVDQIATAVADDDDAPFRRVSGIGPKTAKLIVVHLTGKVIAPAVSSRGASARDDRTDAVTAALTGLGWAERHAAEVAATVVEDAAAEASVQDLLRRALAELGPARKETARG
ncbi:Holliday junction branch migration protein RuvA [Microbacterium schleiferi]|jgi:Holliday junction DNA helicase RuvA|uniref:Holliday junction branch migration complex subunit RuvA n=1 Tax=Microbacterium schleiferi TaxID=69362 RepID=A0A7S8MZZ0_9MICO|nr:Holliday junction branch migration protein RuvA [Microbacterium schleiferi]QPE05833.1 Holliday junction branch migration protein RuvA [Microbacterium schleiferi]